LLEHIKTLTLISNILLYVDIKVFIGCIRDLITVYCIWNCAFRELNFLKAVFCVRMASNIKHLTKGKVLDLLTD
jgi:hypothetical protein